MRLYRFWPIFPALLALVSLACQISSIFETPSSADVLFQDDFSDPSSGWLQGEDDIGTAEYFNGGFRIYVTSDHAAKLSILRLQPFTDVRLEVEATKVAGPDDNDFGLVCRYLDEDNFYFLEISSDGYYGIGKYKNDELILMSATQMQSSEAIVQGAAKNSLRADCIGNSLSLYVNGVKLAEVSDSEFGAGNVGLIAGTFETPGVDIFFDNFTIFMPK